MFDNSYNLVNTNFSVNLCFSAKEPYDCGLRIVVKGKLENPLFEIDRKQQLIFHFTVEHGGAAALWKIHPCHFSWIYTQEKAVTASSCRYAAKAAGSGKNKPVPTPIQLGKTTVITKQALRI